MKPAHFALLILACLLLVTSCARQPMRIAFLAPLSGHESGLGRSGRDGAVLAVEYINSHPELFSCRIDLTILDAGLFSSGPEAALDHLNSRNIKIVIGGMTSSEAQALLPGIERRSMILVSPTASAPRLAGKMDRLFMMTSSVQGEAEFLAAWLGKQPGLREISLVLDSKNTVYVQDYLQFFLPALEQQGIAVKRQFHTAEANINYRAAAAEILKPSAPQAVHFITRAYDTAMLCQHLSLRGYQGLRTASGWSATGDLVQTGGSSVDNLVYPAQTDMDFDSELFRYFVSQYRLRYGMSPNFASVFAWQSVVAIVWANGKGSCNPEALSKNLSSAREIPGLFGPFSFSSTGDARNSFFLFRIVEGTPTKLAFP